LWWNWIRERLDTPDGGNIALDWQVTDLEEDSPILFIAPGLTGSSESPYVLHAMASAREIGFQPVVMIYRGLVGLKLTTPLGYSAGATSDIHLAILHVHRLRPHAPIYAAGYSVGSNILLKYLGEQGKSTIVRAALSIGNPFNLSKSSETLGSNPFYSYALCKLLKRYYATHRETFLQLPHFVKHDSDLQNVKHLRDFDSICTAFLFQFDSVDHYYTESSSSKFIESTLEMTAQNLGKYFPFCHITHNLILTPSSSTIEFLSCL
jgi:predicted alpha/beta-fold hydrolase